MTADADAGLNGQTILMSGGSRGIGLAVALRAARDGANVVLLAKTDAPDPRLHGTIHTAVDAITAAGGRAVGVVGDVRDDAAIARAVERAIAEFGGIDVVVNNASVITLVGTLELDPKRYDLMQDVNERGTFMLTKTALPHLLQSARPRVLSMGPPLEIGSAAWDRYPGYMLAKFGMTLATLAFGGEFADAGLEANTLWPRTTIATDAVENLFGGAAKLERARTPEIMADAAHAILTGPVGRFRGETLIDEDVLRREGVTDFARYAYVPGTTDFDDDLLGTTPPTG
jgi:citronellol/citronellal dehydrogenase